MIGHWTDKRTLGVAELRPTGVAMTRLRTVVVLVGAATTAFAIVVLAYYVERNTTCHAGFEPRLLAALFLPVSLVGLLETRRRSRIAGGTALLLGVLGLAELAYLDFTGRMLQYERWVGRGMVCAADDVRRSSP